MQLSGSAGLAVNGPRSVLDTILKADGRAVVSVVVGEDLSHNYVSSVRDKKRRNLLMGS